MNLESLGRSLLENPLSPESQKEFADALGVADLAATVIRAVDRSGIDTLIPHLTLLAESDFAQNQYSEREDSGADKIFELSVGAVCMAFASDVELDDPHRSSGGLNPDVLATWRGRRWGIACKALHSESREGFFANVEKGARQVEASAAEIGLLFFSLKNLWPYHLFWVRPPPSDQTQQGSIGVLRGPEEAHHMVKDTLSSIVDRLRAYVTDEGHEHLRKIFRGKKTRPMVVFPVQMPVIMASPEPWAVGHLTRIEAMFFFKDFEPRQVETFLKNFDRHSAVGLL